jgi:hypothetical protein
MRAFLVSISIVVATFATLTMYARAQGVAEGRAQVAELYDAGPVDPVVAADHAIRPVAALAVPDDPPPVAKPAPGLVAKALVAAGPLGRLALGGIACLLVARLLSWQRARRGWLRRGWTGNAAAAGYGALVAFGGVLALGGSIESGLVAVGGATLYGLGLGADPETARKPKAEAGEEVPT